MTNQHTAATSRFWASKEKWKSGSLPSLLKSQGRYNAFGLVLAHLNKSDTASLALTNSILYDHLRKKPRMVFTISSPEHLREFLKKLDDLVSKRVSDKAEIARIGQLNIHWPSRTSYPPAMVANIGVIEDKCKRIIADFNRLLRKYSPGLFKLTADFVGSFECITEGMVIYPLAKNHMRTIRILTIGNAGVPLFKHDQHCRYLFSAISHLAAQTLVELNIDGGYTEPTPPTFPKAFSRGVDSMPIIQLFEFDVPNETTENRDFESLDKLRNLRVKNLPHFYSRLFLWAMNGKHMMGGPDDAPGRILHLENVPDLNVHMVLEVLRRMGSGLQEFRYIAPDIAAGSTGKGKRYTTFKEEEAESASKPIGKERIRVAADERSTEFKLLYPAIYQLCPNLESWSLNFGSVGYRDQHSTLPEAAPDDAQASPGLI